MSPDRIAIGAFHAEDGDAVAGLYAGIDAPIVRSDVNSAEMIKLAANAFLMTRISFINEIANVCEATGADVVEVARGIGLDHRLGPHFLRAGIGYGGSCLRGEETVGIREGEDMRTTTLARLFDHLSDGDPDREVVQLDGLGVFAWSPETCDPGFFPAVAITRRWFEGELIGVKHGFMRGVRVTPDHPFVVAAEAGGPTTVKLAGELTEDDWLPFVQTWRNKRVQYPRPVPAIGSRVDGGVAVATEDVIESAAVDWIVTDWARVQLLRRFPFQGHVYSLEVPGPHTFVTTAGLVVHNCFPKDSLALKQLASNSGYHFQLLSAVIEVNELQKRRVIAKLKRHLGALRGKKVALLGLAFKPDTDDMREAPSIVLASRLLAEGADVRAWDPVADGTALPKGVDMASSVLEAVEGADAAVIVTEWSELKGLAREEVRAAMAHPLIIDGRNLLDPEAVRDAGFAYEGIGRPISSTDMLPTTPERDRELQQ
jgi:UDP-glucose 6-dehydrogenase